MAPEFQPRLTVLNLHFDGETLVGAVEYVEGGDNAALLTILWTVDGQPDGYFPVGDGVAFVKRAEGVFPFKAAERAKITSLDDGTWAWIQGIPHPHTSLVVI